MAYLLHVRFDFNGTAGNAQKDVATAFPFEPATKKMNSLPNLKWKIWAVNADYPGEHPEASGFYLYPTKEAAESRAAEAKSTLPLISPFISNVQTTVWEVLDDYSLATHAPIDVPLISELT